MPQIRLSYKLLKEFQNLAKKKGQREQTSPYP